MSRSCLIEKIGYHIPLSPADEALLARLEQDEESFRADSTVRGLGAPADRLYVVRKGWFYAYTMLPDGGRQILHIHYPGDIVGLPDIAFVRTNAALAAAVDGTLCPFPKSALDEVFIRSPRLSALLFSIGMVEHAVLADRLRIVSRQGATSRVAHFLLEVVSRLRVTRRDLGTGYDLPLSQSMIGDAVGLTNVHVSRALKRLEASGAIARQGRWIDLLDEPGLRSRVDFEDRHFRIDTSWFPAA
ncbi:MAG: Crp/Fnr family transcriptional regulator [Pseudomonadota bacterium]